MDDILKPNKKNWKKSDPLIMELISQVQMKATGSKDAPMSQEDFSNLNDDIYGKNKTTIDDRTIKEYFGYYQSRTDGCSLSILNAFAVYLGYKDFYAFKKENDTNLKKPGDTALPEELREVTEVKDGNTAGKNKNKAISLIAVAAIIIPGLLLFLFFNQKAIEKPDKETEKTENREKTVQDSVPGETGKKKPGILKEDAEKVNLPESKKMETAENFTGYLNSNTKSDIAILIVDDNKQPENELSARIAGLYRSQGYSVTYSLFTTGFIQSEYFYELQNASSRVITMLELDSHITTLILGELSYSYRNGTLEKGTIICNAKINMRIVSVNQKSLTNSFSFSVNGNGVSEAQAKEQAFTKLFDKYEEEYSTL